MSNNFISYNNDNDDYTSFNITLPVGDNTLTIKNLNGYLFNQRYFTNKDVIKINHNINNDSFQSIFYAEPLYDGGLMNINGYDFIKVNELPPIIIKPTSKIMGSITIDPLTEEHIISNNYIKTIFYENGERITSTNSNYGMTTPFVGCISIPSGKTDKTKTVNIKSLNVGNNFRYYYEYHNTDDFLNVSDTVDFVNPAERADAIKKIKNGINKTHATFLIDDDADSSQNELCLNGETIRFIKRTKEEIITNVKGRTLQESIIAHLNALINSILINYWYFDDNLNLMVRMYDVIKFASTVNSDTNVLHSKFRILKTADVNTFNIIYGLAFNDELKTYEEMYTLLNDEYEDCENTNRFPNIDFLKKINVLSGLHDVNKFFNHHILSVIIFIDDNGTIKRVANYMIYVKHVYAKNYPTLYSKDNNGDYIDIYENKNNFNEVIPTIVDSYGGEYIHYATPPAVTFPTDYNDLGIMDKIVVDKIHSLTSLIGKNVFLHYSRFSIVNVINDKILPTILLGCDLYLSRQTELKGDDVLISNVNSYFNNPNYPQPSITSVELTTDASILMISRINNVIDLNELQPIYYPLINKRDIGLINNTLNSLHECFFIGQLMPVLPLIFISAENVFNSTTFNNEGNNIRSLFEFYQYSDSYNWMSNSLTVNEFYYYTPKIIKVYILDHFGRRIPRRDNVTGIYNNIFLVYSTYYNPEIKKVN